MPPPTIMVNPRINDVSACNLILSRERTRWHGAAINRIRKIETNNLKSWQNAGRPLITVLNLLRNLLPHDSKPKTKTRQINDSFTKFFSRGIFFLIIQNRRQRRRQINDSFTKFFSVLAQEHIAVLQKNDVTNKIFSFLHSIGNSSRYSWWWDPHDCWRKPGRPRRISLLW